MTDINDSIFIRALKRQAIPRTPVWLMRQAGRYLPEYRKVRAQAGDFLSLCRNKELACEVTLQPLRRFALDAAILFSDILTIPDAMGLGLYFTEGEGPAFQHPLRDAASIQRLPVPCMGESLSYVMDAVRLIRQEMPATLPLIGFSGSPWTLACYMLQGKSSPDFSIPRQWLQADPVSLHLLLKKLADAVSDYLLQQIKAGVNAVMLFDTWGGLLNKEQYNPFSLFYMQQIITTIKQQAPTIPIILFTKGGKDWLIEMAESGCDGLGVDWMCNLTQARQQVGHKVALQGNLEPAILLQPPQRIEQEVAKVLNDYGKGASGHIFNLGHGITPDILPEHVAVMVEAVHRLSPAFHSA